MKTLICDDHKIVRAGIKQLLQQWPGNLIKEAGNGTEAIEMLQKNDFDIVLLDVSLPGISGLELLEIIKKRWRATNVLMLSVYSKEQDAIRAFKLGASGYLATDAALEELFIAVKRIAAGGKYISSAIAEKLADNLLNSNNTLKHNMLSKREFVTMIKLAKGESLKEIGNELSISNKTVSTYRARIMKKMNLYNNSQLTRYCMEHELI
ncbi:MAG: response regulator transcription factor [Bacteroidetes bacterium]|nr:response regulator transcription factor [Bacteroidota bacterium]